MSTRSTLSATNLVHTYGQGPTASTALAGVNLGVEAGAAIAVMGPSGSGKTTLLHCLAGVIRPTSGQITWAGMDLATLPDRHRTALRRTDFGFVFQSGQLLPELPAEENVALPLLLGNHPRRQAVDAARSWLSYLGVADLAHRRPGEMSGGQAQRVAIARALVGSPGVVFADEPTGNLDQATSADVMHVLTGAAQAAGAAVVVVTHDPGIAQWCQRTVNMRDGQIITEQARANSSAQQPAPAHDDEQVGSSR